ncbi:MAG TPA: antibiotic biosynthesis monooxygenase [Clostridia bacterium]|nr:antibiotic biosynthesis monooxygenase [Clostridia bacterium]
MYVLNVYYYAKQGKREEFLKRIYEANIPQLCREESGNIQYDYFVSRDSENVILIAEKWEDKESQIRHCEASHIKTLAAIKSECIEDTVIETYNG